MKHTLRILTAALLGLAMIRSAVAANQPAADPSVPLQKIRHKLAANQPVKIVCLGDSVTGLYYHTGGRRAYATMLALALKIQYPEARVTVINAGISGNTTVDALRRLQKDVLDHKPDLVTVMFGLNDMVRVPIPDYETNLGQIIQQCRNQGAEVLLCTPNSVTDTPKRPVARLIEYCTAMKAVAEKYHVPVSDVYAAYEALRSRDPLAWRLLHSDEIHPNMDGHKLIAETICRAISDQDVSLRSVGPLQPAIPKTLALLKAGKPVHVLAMPPYDTLIGPALRAVVPSAKVEVRPWPTADQTLAQIEAAAKLIRSSPPDLVLVAIPAALLPSIESPPDDAIHAYTWILNWSLSFDVQQWDVVGIAPSVLNAPQSPLDSQRDQFARRQILAQDLGLIARPDHNTDPPQQILEHWLRDQFTAEKAN